MHNKDIETMKACMRCPIPYSECPAISDCPKLLALLRQDSVSLKDDGRGKEGV